MWFSVARKRQVQNFGGPMVGHLGLVLHVQEGNGDLAAQFNNPASESSYTWVVYKDGGIDQFVDSDRTAWGHSKGNATYNSVGTQGFANEPLTEAACRAIAELYQWGNKQYGWPFRLAEAPGRTGFGWHGMGGNDWGGHPGCPGDLRKNQRQHVLDLTQGSSPATSPGNADPLGSPATSAAPPFSGRMLRLREPFLIGEDVKTWQTQMAKRGWRIDADGIFGPDAEATSRKFQTEKGIGVDGIVGPDTWRATWESVITPGKYFSAGLNFAPRLCLSGVRSSGETLRGRTLCRDVGNSKRAKARYAITAHSDDRHPSTNWRPSVTARRRPWSFTIPAGVAAPDEVASQARCSVLALTTGKAVQSYACPSSQSCPMNRSPRHHTLC